VDSLLSEIGFERKRISFVSLAEGNKTDILLSTINDMAETLRVELQEV
jgi:hypothetical protein